MLLDQVGNLKRRIETILIVVSICTKRKSQRNLKRRIETLVFEFGFHDKKET